MTNFGFPIIPFPGEKFSPLACNKDGEICAEPTVAALNGVHVCKYHLAGVQPFQNVIAVNRKARATNA